MLVKVWNVDGVLLSTEHICQCRRLHGAGGIPVTVFVVRSFVLCVRRILVTDISGVGWRTATKFCRLIDLGVHQVFSPFGNLWPSGKLPRSKIEKSITRSTVVSPVRQTCPTVADRVRNRPPLAR